MLVIDSIRHPAEVDALRAGAANFALLAVECDVQQRFARLCARGRAGDSRTLAEFEAAEAAEMGSSEADSSSAQQQNAAVLALADARFDNSADDEAPLRAQLDRSE